MLKSWSLNKRIRFFGGYINNKTFGKLIVTHSLLIIKIKVFMMIVKLLSLFYLCLIYVWFQLIIFLTFDLSAVNLGHFSVLKLILFLYFLLNYFIWSF